MTRPDRFRRYLYDEPPPTLVHPAVLPELAPDAAGDHNPLGLAIFHRDGGVDEHDCRPRVRARCHGACRRDLVLCALTDVEVKALLRGRWTCGQCQGGA